MPPPQASVGIFIEMPLELAALITSLPDKALQSLQWRRLTVFINPTKESLHGGVHGVVAGCENLGQFQLFLHNGLMSVGLNKGPQLPLRVRKKHLVHK